MSKPKPVEKMTYEEAFEELKAVVEQLESEELPLEESLALFERGQALSQHCSELLEKAQLKLKQLVPGPSGDLEETDFEIEDA